MSDPFAGPRKALVERLKHKGIDNQPVLEAINRIPREQFVEPGFEDKAYVDTALPILAEQTISQPYIVARMTSAALGDRRLKKVLEVGTGSGYQAAVLSVLINEVYTIERIKELHQRARERFEQLKLDNIYDRHGDGYLGWPEVAPFDAILVTAAAEKVPEMLKEQLAMGGRLIIPVDQSSGGQVLQAITRVDVDTYTIEYLDPVRFVPFVKGCAK